MYIWARTRESEMEWYLASSLIHLVLFYEVEEPFQSLIALSGAGEEVPNTLSEDQTCPAEEDNARIKQETQLGTLQWQFGPRKLNCLWKQVRWNPGSAQVSPAEKYRVLEISGQWLH